MNRFGPSLNSFVGPGSTQFGTYSSRLLGSRPRWRFQPTLIPTRDRHSGSCLWELSVVNKMYRGQTGPTLVLPL